MFATSYETSHLVRVYIHLFNLIDIFTQLFSHNIFFVMIDIIFVSLWFIESYQFWENVVYNLWLSVVKRMMAKGIMVTQKI